MPTENDVKKAATVSIVVENPSQALAVQLFFLNSAGYKWRSGKTAPIHDKMVCVDVNREKKQLSYCSMSIWDEADVTISYSEWEQLITNGYLFNNPSSLNLEKPPEWIQAVVEGVDCEDKLKIKIYPKEQVVHIGCQHFKMEELHMMKELFANRVDYIDTLVLHGYPEMSVNDIIKVYDWIESVMEEYPDAHKVEYYDKRVDIYINENIIEYRGEDIIWKT